MRIKTGIALVVTNLRPFRFRIDASRADGEGERLWITRWKSLSEPAVISEPVRVRTFSRSRYFRPESDPRRPRHEESNNTARRYALHCSQGLEGLACLRNSKERALSALLIFVISFRASPHGIMQFR